MGYGINIGVLIISILFFVVATLNIVFNGIVIGLWNKTSEEFNKKKGLTITAIVFDFLVVIATVVMMCLGSSGLVVLFLVIAMLLAIASAVMLLVDLCMENKRSSKQDAAAQVNETVASNDSKLAAAETVEKKLEKLNAMKEHGVITEDEYKELKKSYLKELLG